MEPDTKVPPLNFAYDLPFVSQRKCAIIKVVAKHTVFHPEKLRDREQEFDFLQPKHVLHPLFRAFVKQYELIKNGDPLPCGNVLQRAIERAKTLQTSRAQEPGPAASSPELIDWQDFIVLETVEFFSADHNGTSKLGVPLTATEMRLMRDQPPPPLNEPLFKSTLTGELVPESLYNEHIKMLQIDPTSRVQKEKEQKRSESNLDYDHVAENLHSFRQKRQKHDLS